MRCVYWEHSFHFTQIDQYNTDEDAAGTAAVPINIPTRTYNYLGGFSANQNYLGSIRLTPYDLTLENDTAPAEGIQKLAGTIYSGLPAIKTANGIYFSGVSQNVYRGMPVLPATWDTSGSQVQYIQWTGAGSGAQAAANVVYGTIEDADTADGIKFEAYLSYKNTTTTTLKMQTMFLLVAKPSSQVHEFDFKVCARNTGSVDYTWQDWTSGAIPFATSTGISRWAKRGTQFPPSATIDQNVGILAYSTANDPYCLAHNGLFPTHAAFTGSWDFTVVAWTMYDSNASNPLEGFHGQGGGLDYGSSSNHGRIYAYGSGTATSFDGTLMSTVGTMKDLADYKYDYDNTFNDVTGSSVPYKGTLQAIGLTSGTETAFNIEVDVVNNNTLVYDAGQYFWGDDITVKVSSDGSTYEFAGDGKWVKPTYVWHAGTSQFNYSGYTGNYDKKLVELNLRDIIYNQSIALKQFNGTTALAEINKFYTGTTILKYMNPIGKLTDLDDNEYQLMRGTFNLLMDEWNLTMNQIFYEVPSETINVGEMKDYGEIQAV